MLSWRRALRSPASRAVFLDRDGVINRSVGDGYALTKRDVVFNEASIEALCAIDRAQFAVVVASNQSCVGRGLLTAHGLIELMQYIVAQTERRGLLLDAWYCCPHAPAEACGCRKPAPGLLMQAAHDLGLDLARSYFIGDQATDMGAADRAGVNGLFVRPDDAQDIRAHVGSFRRQSTGRAART